LDRLSLNEIAALRAYKSADDSADGDSHCFAVNSKLQSGLWPDPATQIVLILSGWTISIALITGLHFNRRARLA